MTIRERGMFSDRLVGGGCWRVRAGPGEEEGAREHLPCHGGVVQSLLPSAGPSSNPARGRTGEDHPPDSKHPPLSRRRVFTDLVVVVVVEYGKMHLFFEEGTDTLKNFAKFSTKLACKIISAVREKIFPPIFQPTRTRTENLFNCRERR